MIAKENILEICASYSEARFRSLMPNIRFTESGYVKIGVCLGFLYGLKISGNQEMFDTFADNFIRVFNHPYIHSHDMVDSDRLIHNSDKFQQIPQFMCELSDDGTPLSFRFATYIYDKDAIDRNTTFGYWNDNYRLYAHGGIMFHGLGQNFSVTLSNEPGWGIHT